MQGQWRFDRSAHLRCGRRTGAKNARFAGFECPPAIEMGTYRLYFDPEMDEKSERKRFQGSLSGPTLIAKRFLGLEPHDRQQAVHMQVAIKLIGLARGKRTFLGLG